MSIQLAVSTYSLLQWRKQDNRSVEDCVRWIADQGIPGVEFSGLGEGTIENPIKRAAELRQCAIKAGLAVVGYNTGAEFLVPPDEQRAVIQKVKAQVDIAAELGVKNMRHDVTRGPKEEDLTLAEVLRRIVPAVREVAEYAQSKGLKTSVENHGFYLQTADRVRELVEAVGRDKFGVTLDMGNFLCLNQDPIDAVARLVKYAVIVHVKDFHVKPKSALPLRGWFATPTPIALRGAIVGHGVIDVPAQLKVLKDAGYSGYLSLEFEGLEEPTTAIKLGLDYLREQLAK